MPRHHMIDGEKVPFTLAEEAIRDVAEEAWEIEKPEREMAKLREERNALLSSSDWTQGIDSPLADSVKVSWAVYRQELRDLPATTSDPANPTWPTEPAGD